MHEYLYRSPQRASDHLMTMLIWGAALFVGTVFIALLGDLLVHGLSGLSWSLLTEAPQNAGRDGGIAPILVSTMLILLVAMGVSLPLGIATAVWLSDFTRAGGLTARLVNFCLDVLAGVPSIVFGLFGNAFFCITLGLGFSILSGGLTLACMILPILIRTIESGLSAAPNEWRRGAAALGLSRFTTVTRILLPAAAPAMAAGLMLGIGRAMAETAALIFTSGYVDRLPESLLDSGRSLAVHIYDLSMNVTGGERMAYASSLVLVASLCLINFLALQATHRFLGRRITH
jgi:phosphate transport system permease protein